VLWGGENIPLMQPSSRRQHSRRTWVLCYVVRTLHHQPTTPVAETIRIESWNHEYINVMFSVPGGVSWWHCTFSIGGQQQLIVVAIAESHCVWEIGLVNFLTHLSTKIPWESSSRAVIGVIL
jgi:hypothetical protein